MKRCQTDPYFFVQHVLGKDLWWKQVEILESVRDNSYTIVRSGHGIGKTYNAAVTVLWFLFSFHPAKIVTTAPTWKQVESVLWSEINNLHKHSKIPLGGETLKVRLNVTEEHFAVGLSTDNPDSFVGFHSPNILVIFDEGPGVKNDIWDASKGLLTSPNAKFLAIGNPTTPHGSFYDAFKNPLYNKIAISCFDTPNVKENRVVIPGLVTMKWIQERKDEWGEASPLYKSRVLGEFPVEGEDTLIPLNWVEKAMENDYKGEGTRILGVDVARYGSDHTVFIVLEVYGDTKKVIFIDGYVGKPTTRTAGRAKQLREEYNCEKIMVDDVGVGGGVTDILEEQNIPVEGVSFGSSPKDHERFDNLKTEIFWNLREDFEHSRIALPDDKHLLEELPSLMYEVTSRGRMKIVSKDKMKKIGIKSPDYADALAIAHYGSYSSRRGLLDFYKQEMEELDGKEEPMETFINRSDIKGNLQRFTG